MDSSRIEHIGYKVFTAYKCWLGWRRGETVRCDRRRVHEQES